MLFRLKEHALNGKMQQYAKRDHRKQKSAARNAPEKQLAPDFRFFLHRSRSRSSLLDSGLLGGFRVRLLINGFYGRFLIDSILIIQH